MFLKIGVYDLNKPSDRLDFLDKNIDAYNFLLDMQKQSIINEINWLYENYDNLYNLHKYFLKLAKFNNVIINLQYAEQLNSYSDSKIQNMVEYRANILYGNLQLFKNQKIENKPLKSIVQALKLYNC